MLVILCAFSSTHLFSAETVRLKNGYELRCLRHNTRGTVTTLYLDDSGVLEVPTAQIAEFEYVNDITREPAPIPYENGVELTTKQSATQAQASRSSSIQNAINVASVNVGIDADFLASVIMAESDFNPKAISPKGARGLMQLMPRTAAKLGITDSFDADENIKAGSRYLQDLFIQFNGDTIKTLAAYNAGPEAVTRYHGVPPYRETVSYVNKVVRDFNRRKSVSAPITPNSQK